MSISRPLLIGLLLAACPVLSATAVPAPLKELVVIRDYDDCWRFDRAVSHAMALKRAGAEVRVIFQDEAVLAALYIPFPPQVLGGENRAGDRWKERREPGHDYPSGVSGTRPRGSPRHETAEILICGQVMTASERGRRALPEFKALGIPYTVSAFSARALGVYRQLKEKGEPLSGDPARPEDLSALIKAGYKVTIF